MKFLCRNCKAKYQIADDKVVGRTLRMTCQQCGEPIVVRSPTSTGRQSTVGRPAAPIGPTLHGTGPMAAELQRQASAAREVAAPQEEWHVAINDVPVGPMRRDEVVRKIAMSAIDRDSLAWREGMDDWLPIKHIPELARLFPGAAAPPAAAGLGMTISGVPPAPSMPPHAAHVPHPKPVAPVVTPSARVDLPPVGARQVLNLDEYSPPLAAEPALVASIAPESVAPAASGGKPLGWGPMFALVSGGAFILAAGAFLGVRVLAPQQPAPAVVAPAPAVEQKPSPEPVAANQPPAGKSNVIELDVQPIDGQSNTRRTPASSSSAAPSNGTEKKKELTAEQKDMLARMGGGLDQGGPNLRAPSESGHATSGQQGQLTAEQLSAVVLKGRKNLQRCYETALRGSQSSDTVRLDVEIEVSPAGNVTEVKANGKALPGMDECITRTVKMWRFPMSGEVTQTRFPVVFQPGA
jgi:GYF domain 2/zinc-ribbon domain